CHRFRPSRPVATLLATGRQRPKRRRVGALQNGYRVDFMSLGLVPGVNRFAAREIVKDHINASQHFRQQDDLSGVHREMFCHMKDRGEGGRVSALYLIFVQQSRRIESGQHLVYLRNRCPKLSEKFLTRNSLPLSKLSLALTLVGCSSQSANNPLPCVPGNVQQKIPDTVRFGIRPPPHLLL